MTLEPRELDITLSYGSHTRHFPLLSLAAALRLPRQQLRDSLVGLLLASLESEGVYSLLEGEPTEGKSERSEPSEPLPLETTIKPLPNEAFPEREVEEGKPRDDRTLTAEFLASVLDDEQNLQALKLLVEGASTEVLKDALAETLAVPIERIRKSRGAYFTALVRRLTERRGSTASST
jgi:hypothetical protein